MHKAAGLQVEYINIKVNHGLNGKTLLLDMTTTGMQLLEENVEPHLGIENNTVDTYMFGVKMDGTLKIVLVTHGDVVGEIGTGVKIDFYERRKDKSIIGSQ